ncbi:hypothetical protein TL16_g06837 [Triparma laevis f. inornata]|uniref:Uncharacterized protein n=1 Tax=Triparma laevis f. inornata TaxID=1714386 RepID=A0A9W7EGD7_9STRA|nr:hypothetical protein TL16_g06837 [Triparma laevis f. inornata]
MTQLPPPSHLALLLLLITLTLHLTTSTVSAQPHVTHSKSISDPPPIDQTGTVAVDWDAGSDQVYCIGEAGFVDLPMYCRVNVTFKAPFVPLTGESMSPVVFTTARTRITNPTSSIYPVLSTTVLKVCEEYFTVLINTFEAGGSTSSLTSVSLVLDYFAYDPRRSQDKSGDYTQFGSFPMVPRPTVTTLPASALIQFDKPFDNIPVVFAQARLNKVNTQLYSFLVTVTHITEEYMELSFVCSDYIYISPFDETQFSSSSSSSPKFVTGPLDDDPTYACVWTEIFDIDWRAWPQNHTAMVNGTEVITAGGSPIHELTLFTEPPTTQAVTTKFYEFENSNISFTKEAPPGMLGMVYLDTPTTSNWNEVFALSLGIDTGESTDGFYFQVASGLKDSWDFNLKMAWFAWDGTGTNCLSNEDQVICNGHGFCPDKQNNNANKTPCECDANWAGMGCTECSYKYATDKCTACDGYYKGIDNSTGKPNNVEIVCSGHGTCSNGTGGDGHCTCDPGGYTGTGCTQCNNSAGWYGHAGEPYFQECQKCPYSAPVLRARTPPLSCPGKCHDHGECEYFLYGENETETAVCMCEANYDPASNCATCLPDFFGDYCCARGTDGEGCAKCAPLYIQTDVAGPCEMCNPNSEPNEDKTACVCNINYIADDPDGTFPNCEKQVPEWLIITSASSAVFIIGMVCGCWYYRKNRLRKKLELHKLDVLSERLLARNPQLEGMEQAFRTMTSDAADWLIHFDEIELGGVVGSGTSAHVFRGWYSDQAVAVKRLHSIRWDAKEFEAFFTQEAGLIARLHHPNVVRFYGVCYQDDHFYIVTEFCHENLSQALRRLKSELKGPLPPNLAFKLAYQIAKGMLYLHSKNVIHRDLKPENILLDDKGDVKMCDFGLSRLTTNDVEMTQQVGTPAYMAPEMAGVGDTGSDEDEEEPRISIGKPVDVYSYGILLWTLWTQKLPYSDLRVKNPFQLMVKVTNGYRPPIPKEMPTILQSLMQKCWAGDPTTRPTFVQVVEEIREYMKAEGNNSSIYKSGSSAIFGSHSGSQGKHGSASPNDHFLVSPNVRGSQPPDNAMSPPTLGLHPSSASKKKSGVSRAEFPKKDEELNGVVDGNEDDKLKARGSQPG